MFQRASPPASVGHWQARIAQEQEQQKKEDEAATSQGGAGDEQPIEVPERCWQAVYEASTIEERAMVFDRAGAYPGAVDLYNKAASKLSEAARMCPEQHPDAPVIDRHVREVRTRAAYLESLGVRPADVPLEEHIHGARLTMGPSDEPSSGKSTQRTKTTIAAAAIAGGAGLLLLGPHCAAACAVGAAYTSTRQDRAGKVARGVGKAGVYAADKAMAHVEVPEQVTSSKKLLVLQAKAIDEKLHVTEAARAVDARLSISEKAKQASDAASEATKAAAVRARELDDRYAVTERAQQATQAAATKTVQTVRDLNNRYDLTGKASQGIVSVASATSALSGLVLKAARSSGYGGGSGSRSRAS